MTRAVLDEAVEHDAAYGGAAMVRCHDAELRQTCNRSENDATRLEQNSGPQVDPLI